jgi:drug/metabolite transporter (DMT)-like permease
MSDSVPGLSGWLGLLYLGIFQLGTSYVIYTLAIAHVTAMEAILIPLIEPILNPIWVFLLMDEVPSLTSIAGGVVIVAAVALRHAAGMRPQ